MGDISRVFVFVNNSMRSLFALVLCLSVAEIIAQNIPLQTWINGTITPENNQFYFTFNAFKYQLIRYDLMGPASRDAVTLQNANTTTSIISLGTGTITGVFECPASVFEGVHTIKIQGGPNSTAFYSFMVTAQNVTLQDGIKTAESYESKLGTMRNMVIVPLQDATMIRAFVTPKSPLGLSIRGASIAKGRCVTPSYYDYNIQFNGAGVTVLLEIGSSSTPPFDKNSAYYLSMQGTSNQAYTVGVCFQNNCTISPGTTAADTYSSGDSTPITNTGGVSDAVITLSAFWPRTHEGSTQGNSASDNTFGLLFFVVQMLLVVKVLETV